MGICRQHGFDMFKVSTQVLQLLPDRCTTIGVGRMFLPGNTEISFPGDLTIGARLLYPRLKTVGIKRINNALAQFPWFCGSSFALALSDCSDEPSLSDPVSLYGDVPSASPSLLFFTTGFDFLRSTNAMIAS